jgi:hypothetical protein
MDGARSYRFNLRVPPDWMDRVRAAAGRRGISMADYVVMVVYERLQMEPPAPPEQPPPKRTTRRGKR